MKHELLESGLQEHALWQQLDAFQIHSAYEHVQGRHEEKSAKFVTILSLVHLAQPTGGTNIDTSEHQSGF